MTEPQAIIPSLLSGQALSVAKGSGETAAEILRCAQDDMPGPLRMTCWTLLKAAQDDMPDPSQARSREAFLYELLTS